ncbi:MAG: hypothetical protein PHD81_01185 [Candidatus Nanoarchaeia archaeon]|nr:hypothetical protein [Candidatus Nanoarchaeia archaeon]MDD5587704.1 hypothetical protein [Candidatus Nanoarchaeia archaeon]
MKLKIKAIIEIAGFPEEHIKKVMNEVMENLEKEKGIQVITKDVAEVKKVQETLWSTFADLELQLDDMEVLTNFCFNYMPSSVEIIEPLKLDGEIKPIENMINDLLARLHNFTMYLKNLQAENILLKKQLEERK